LLHPRQVLDRIPSDRSLSSNKSLRRQNPWKSKGHNRYINLDKQDGESYIKVIRKTRGKTPEGKTVWFTEEKYEKVISRSRKMLNTRNASTGRSIGHQRQNPKKQIARV
jgi:hypothetical protein